MLQLWRLLSFMKEKNPQKKMQASGLLKEPGSVHLGLFKIDAVGLTVARAVAAGREFMIFNNVFLVHSV